MNTNFSSMFTLGWNDFGRGLVMAVIGAVLVTIYPVLVAHTLPNLSDVGFAASVAGTGYLVKNFFSNSQGKFVGTV